MFDTEPETGWAPFAAGVEVRTDCDHWDEFRGTGQALIAAGVVPPGHFPGDPGMCRSTVRVLKNGEVSLRKSPWGDLREGDRVIRRTSRRQFLVHLFVSDEESERRHRAWMEARHPLQLQPASLDVPVSAHPTLARVANSSAGMQRNASHLLLVWDADATILSA